MPDTLEKLDLVPVAQKSVTGRQAYFLEVPGSATASRLSVVSFDGVERIGEPYRLTIMLTHQDELSRADYLGKDASFSIVPADASSRKFSGWITRFSKLKTTKDFISYEMVVEAHFSRLAATRASRVYQHQTTPEIIEAVLRRHGFQGTHARSVAQGYTVADYNPEQAWERFKADANVASDDATTYGKPYIYGTSHLDADGAQWEAQLRHEAEIAWQVVYEGESNVLALQPGRILHIDAPLADAPDGQVVIEVTHRGGRDDAYTNSYKAIPSGRRFRLQLDEDAWPKVVGSLSARVTSPGKYKYAYLTQQGYYVVRFDLDFDEWNPGGESVPLRLAKPFAGALQTGIHFPALDGTEAVVEFRDGNPDKPYIAAFHHNSQAVDHVTSDDRWLSRNVIRTQSNNKLRMEDWEGQEGIKLSTEHSGKSQLNLGYLVDAKKQKRGEGFELRTSGYGAIRGGRGIFISADDQPGAGGAQLEMEAAKKLLADTFAQMQRLNECANAAKVQLADIESQRDLIEERLADLKQAVMLASAPSGMAFATANSLQLAAEHNLTATARSNLELGAGNRVSIAAGQGMSLFAQDNGIKLVAAKADFSAAAHSGNMQLAASKEMTLSSVNGTLTAVSSGALTLSSQGAYIKLDGGNIELGCPGSITLKTGNFTWQGPANMNPPLPELPVGVCRQCLLNAHSGVEAMTEKA